MDNGQQAQLIERRLGALEKMPIHDDQSARDALAHVMLTVNHISQLSSQAPTEATASLETPLDDILKKLQKWLDRLVSKLTQIVEKLAKATSFSISAGTGVSVTVNFGPFESNSA